MIYSNGRGPEWSQEVEKGTARRLRLVAVGWVVQVMTYRSLRDRTSMLDVLGPNLLLL